MTFWNRGKNEHPRIYADAAASTPLSARARAELVRLLEMYGNPGGLHKEGVAAKEELERARATVAAAVGAHADEIVFTASGTEANNLALHAAHGQVITTTIEHPSVLEPLYHSGARVTEVLGIEEIKKAITLETTLVSVQLVNSEVGLIQPVREIAKLLRKQNKKIVFHTDASQAPLWLDIDVEKLGVDLMTLDAQKILGPKGVGALYIRRGTPVEPQLYGGGQEWGLRSGTENVPLIGAFAEALREAQEGAGERAAHVAEVRDYLWSEIKKVLPDAVLNGLSLAGAAKSGDERPRLEGESEGLAAQALRVANNLNISVPDLNGEMAVIALDALGVAVSTKSACSTGEEDPSPVLLALGVAPELAAGAIRITLLPGVSRADADAIAAALAEVAARYRQS